MTAGSRHRRRKKKRVARAVGEAPGTLRSHPEAKPPEIRVVGYGPSEFQEAEIRDVASIRGFTQKFPIVWVNVDGLADAPTVAAIGEIFGLHRLALEDVLHLDQRAKIEDYGNHLFIVLQNVTLGERIEDEQIAIFLGEKFVVTFQESPGDCLEPVRDRIRAGRGRHRSAGADYLAYSIIDAIVDRYFPVLEAFEDRMEDLEPGILDSKDEKTSTSNIHDIRQDLRILRRAVWPMRDMLDELMGESTSLVSEGVHVYLRDCADHVERLVDLIEFFRDHAADLMHFQLASLSNRLNEVMKILTLVTTIFIPLTFIVGIYGMNFDPDSSPWNMPELRARYGYPITIAVMAAIGLGLYWSFRRRKWL